MKKTLAIPARLLNREILTDAEQQELSALGDNPLTDEELLQREVDEFAHQQAKVKKHNRKILERLEDIDRKSIRAMREGNEARLEALEQEAALLRADLK
jgi:hypothetical protein